MSSYAQKVKAFSDAEQRRKNERNRFAQVGDIYPPFNSPFDIGGSNRETAVDDCGNDSGPDCSTE